MEDPSGITALAKILPPDLGTDEEIDWAAAERGGARGSRGTTRTSCPCTAPAPNDIELVFLPTYGSWLNWIESEFAALRYLVLNGTDHRSHGEQNAAIGAYVRWRNARAEPKTSFAPDSPIRTWTEYPGQGCLTVRYPSVGCCRGGPAGNPGAAARRARARSPARPSRPG
ncbi:hypothetical protein GCM10010502_73610 [Kitasatospora aureofaciens]|uniref:Tc1-like transposase DDE domain-containing protein n=2 Tax=Kitasatospora aureofaciens TaxID=1894 RepID=A0A8H9I087_KITAU|nr:hypothetical protein GCM10010502_73610 [Kitasatospora aureofaciens]